MLLENAFNYSELSLPDEVIELFEKPIVFLFVESSFKFNNLQISHQEKSEYMHQLLFKTSGLDPSKVKQAHFHNIDFKISGYLFEVFEITEI